MATVTGLTASRMLEIEAESVVNGTVDGAGHLILTKHDGTVIDSGSVIGPAGPTGATGPAGGGISVVTSTTRPAGPTAGRLIYETDTDRAYVYDGTAWQEIMINTNQSDPWGVAAGAVQQGATVLANAPGSWSNTRKLGGKHAIYKTHLVDDTPAAAAGVVMFNLPVGWEFAQTNGILGTAVIVIGSTHYVCAAMPLPVAAGAAYATRSVGFVRDGGTDWLGRAGDPVAGMTYTAPDFLDVSLDYLLLN